MVEATKGSKLEFEPVHGMVARPDHVAPERVVDFDYRAPLPPGEDNYDVLARLQQHGPEVLWTPRNGGHWIVVRGEDIRWVQENFAIFSHEVFTIPRGSTRIIMPPLTVDPPLHARFRAVFNPFLSPGKVAILREKTRGLAIDLIEGLKGQGGCEFVSEFASVLPVVVFLGIVDLPVEMREEFLQWGHEFALGKTQEQRDAGLKKVLTYLNRTLHERYANPGSDLLSAIAAWRDNPRFGSEDEIQGMAALIYFGGLDTVASAISFMMRHLAQHPGHRRRILEDPAIIPRAAEEYLRRHGLSNTGRLITRDVEYKGATMKADEMIMVPIGCSSIDDRLYHDPLTVDFDRPELFTDNGTPTHNTFGNGPHKCVGAPLARAELQIVLEEWLPRIPDFRLDPARPVRIHMDSVPGIDEMHLLFD
ncbi:MAG TPA: cytochrome P450 [Novosphingobium sp.]